MGGGEEGGQQEVRAVTWNDSDCSHSYCCKSVAECNECKWILKESLFTKEIVADHPNVR